MPVFVANIWKHHRTESEIRVYIGSACRGYPQSPLANPYKASEHGKGNTLWLTDSRRQRLDTRSGRSRLIWVG